MDNIFIKQGTRSPEVTFDFNQNSFEIKGESYPEDVNEFYGDVMDKLEKHLSEIGDANIKFGSCLAEPFMIGFKARYANEKQVCNSFKNF